MRLVRLFPALGTVLLLLAGCALGPQATPPTPTASAATPTPAAPLQVRAVQPAEGALDVPLDAAIVVAFNQPVVPLQPREGEPLPDPLQISPPAPGKGEWQSTSIYRYTPVEPLLPSTVYRVSLAADLISASGAKLEAPFSWSFTTIAPSVRRVSPRYDEAAPNLVAMPTDPVTIEFAQPMQRESVQKGLDVRIGSKNGPPVTGRITWEEGEKLVFTPERPWPRGEVIFVALRGALARGGVPLDELEFRFRVAPPLALAFSRPADGEGKVSPGTVLQLQFSAPVEKETLEKGLKVEPKPTYMSFYWETEQVAYVDFGARAGTSYTVTIPATLRDTAGQELGKEVRIRFTTADYEPMFQLVRAWQPWLYGDRDRPEAFVSYRNVSRVDFALYRLSLASFQRWVSEDWQFREGFSPSRGDLLRAWSVPTDARRNEWGFLRTALTEDGEPLPAGLYYLTATVPELPNPQPWERQQQVVIVSSSAITVKAGSGEGLAWVTGWYDGQPQAGVPVRFFSASGATIASGKTDGDGLFAGPMSGQEPWQPYLVVAGEPGERGFGVATTNWTNGISPWKYDIPFGYLSPYSIYLYTDREIYRPGQKVYYKGIVRLDEDARYRLPPALELQLTCTDPQGRVILTQPVVLNEMRTFAGELSLSSEAPLGWYSLSLSGPELGPYYYFSTPFQVAAYRRPEFEVQLSTDRQEYTQGDEIKVSAQATYYFGGAVADAVVRWAVLTQDYFFPWQGEGWYDFGDYDYRESRQSRGPYGELLTEGEGKLDADGRFSFSIAADLGERLTSQVFTIEVTVTDLNNQEVSNRRAVVVHQGEFYIGLRPASYVNELGKPTTIEVITVDSGSRPFPKAMVDVSIYEHRWYNVQEKVGEGYQWRTSEEDILLQQQTVATDASGRASITFTPEKVGSYKVVAQSHDARGNLIRASTYLWVGGAGYVSWPLPQDYTVELVTDKKSYRIGETARVLIPSPYTRPVMALFTVERGRVLQRQVLEVDSSAYVLEVPIAADFAPNVYFSVVLVRGVDEGASLPPLQVGYASVSVEIDPLLLSLRVQPAEPGPFEPGQTVQFTLEARDSQGNPVDAELSLAMVDKSVLALALGQQVSIVDHFYSKKGLGVQTASSLSLSAEALAPEGEGKGGGGGGPEAGPAVRERFPDTAFWEPFVRTGSDGKATISIPLPDNITTWSLAVKGVTAETLVGEAVTELVATKSLLARPTLPRFLTVGDRASIGAVIHNNSHSNLEVEVTCALQGIEGAPQPQRVAIAAGSRATVSWEVTASAAGQATITITAKGGPYSDAVRLSLPVYPLAVAQLMATSGEVEPGGSRTEQVRVPENLQGGRLSLQVEASLAASMVPGLDYLRHYPYECVEQTLSRFLPNVLTARALEKLGVADKRLAPGLAEQVAVGLQRLYNFQHDDGGWGWWYADGSNPQLSAYVVLGLAMARDAGYTVDQYVLDRGITFLAEALAGHWSPPGEEKLTDDVRAYMAYALAVAGRGDLGTTISLYERRSGLSTRARAELLLSLQILSPEDPRLQTLLEELRREAVSSATTAHWEGREDFRLMTTDVVTTATVVAALSRTAPEDPLLPSAVRWLMAARQADHWRSTYETAVTIMALTDFLIARQELHPSYSWQATLNGQNLATGTYTDENVTAVERVEVELARLLVGRANEIALSRRAHDSQDKGRLYYSLALEHYVPPEQVRAVDAGIVVGRQYRKGPEGEQTVQAAVGDMVQVKLTIVAPQDLYYVVVEDPFPAGCEGVDTSLRTTTVVGVAPETRRVGEPWGWWWFSHSEMRDDKVVLFATYLPRGTYEYTYYVRASTPGRYTARPARAYQMYFPDVYGTSEAMPFEVLSK